MNDYTSKKQPNDLPVMVGGIGTSGLQDTDKDGCDCSDAKVSMSPNDGGNPSIGPSVPAPSGADLRNREGGNVSNDSPGMPGA